MLIKICGITNLDDALLCAEAGATAVGFNFYPPSPRYIDPAAVRAIGLQLPPSILRVGIFVNETPVRIAEIVRDAALDVVQLHGEACHPLEGLRFWRALPAGAPLDDPGAEAFLLDTPSKTLHGGTGQTFDWTLARHGGKRIIVAGGLDASNVAAAIRAAQPWGVDSCSRLESSPGKKDPMKVREFIQAAMNL